MAEWTREKIAAQVRDVVLMVCGTPDPEEETPGGSKDEIPGGADRRAAVVFAVEEAFPFPEGVNLYEMVPDPLTVKDLVTKCARALGVDLDAPDGGLGGCAG